MTSSKKSDYDLRQLFCSRLGSEYSEHEFNLSINTSQSLDPLAKIYDFYNLDLSSNTNFLDFRKSHDDILAYNCDVLSAIFLHFENNLLHVIVKELQREYLSQKRIIVNNIFCRSYYITSKEVLIAAFIKELNITRLIYCYEYFFTDCVEEKYGI